MGIVYSWAWALPYSGGSVNITDNNLCDLQESYCVNKSASSPTYSAICEGVGTDSVITYNVIGVRMTTSASSSWRRAFWKYNFTPSETGRNDTDITSGLSNPNSPQIPLVVRGSSSSWTVTSFIGVIGTGSSNGPCNLTISTNIPIFDTEENARSYCFGSDANAIELLKSEHCLNCDTGGKPFDDTTNEYYIYNRYKSVTIERGIVTDNNNIIHQLNERILYNGNNGICLYRDSNNKFLLKLKVGDEVVGSYFSNTETISDVDYNLFSEDIEYYEPFYSTYDRSFGITDYQGNIAIGLYTNIPIWDNESDADDYLDGNLDISNSSNWDKISGDSAYKNIITNLTELPEEETEFGEVFVRNVFSQLYLCDVGALYDISNNLFDYTPDATIQGQWEKIKKGLDMYGSNPMDAIQGLRFYPFDLTSIFTNIQPQNYIYFGAYKQDISGTVYKMIYANGYKDLGSVTIKRTFKDWRDFEPYTRLYIYLPYIGRFKLDLTKYYDKTINIRYYIDLRTGVCCACLIANGVLLDWFDGIIGTEMPITLTDYASYAQTQLSIIARNAGIGGLATALTSNAINKELATHLGSTEVPASSGDPFDSLASTSSGAAGTAGMVASGVGLAVGVGAVVAGAVMKTRFDMTNNGTGKYNSTRGTSSAMINQFLPQYPTFMFEVQEIDESPYLNELYGRPSNASGAIGDFSGYLEAEDVMLICPIATDNERQEIIDLVRSGIYI